MKIYWVRHGKTEYNLDRKLQGWIDSPLVKDDQSPEIAAEKLVGIKFDHICSSDLNRAITTKKRILNILNIEDEENEYIDFREIHFGNWEGLKLDYILENYGDLWRAFKKKTKEYNPKEITGGESIEDLRNRITNKLIELKNVFGDDSTILIVSHGTVISVMNELSDIPENGEIIIQNF